MSLNEISAIVLLVSILLSVGIKIYTKKKLSEIDGLGQVHKGKKGIYL